VIKFILSILFLREEIMLRISTLAALGAVVLSAGSAAAQARVEVGVLSCRGATTSYILASISDLGCVFRRADGKTFRYHAVVRRVGVDLGINQTTALEWGVYAPSHRIGRGDLRGAYGGVSAGVSIGLGLGANVLLGGSGNTIALQPVSVEGQTGLSVNAGISGLELSDEGRPRRKARRR
jgi:hypothetical protein